MRFSLIKKYEAFQQNFMKVGGQEVATSKYGANKDLGSSCSGDSSHGKVKIEETDGSSSVQKEYDLPVLVHGSICP